MEQLEMHLAVYMLLGHATLIDILKQLCTTVGNQILGDHSSWRLQGEGCPSGDCIAQLYWCGISSGNR